MDEQVDLSSDQQAAVTAVSELETVQDHPPTLEEIAGRVGWPRTRAREVLSTLLADDTDLLREIPAAEPAEAGYRVRQRPT